MDPQRRHSGHSRSGQVSTGSTIHRSLLLASVIVMSWLLEKRAAGSCFFGPLPVAVTPRIVSFSKARNERRSVHSGSPCRMRDAPTRKVPHRCSRSTSHLVRTSTRYIDYSKRVRMPAFGPLKRGTADTQLADFLTIRSSLYEAPVLSVTSGPRRERSERLGGDRRAQRRSREHGGRGHPSTPLPLNGSSTCIGRRSVRSAWSLTVRGVRPYGRTSTRSARRRTRSARSARRHDERAMESDPRAEAPLHPAGVRGARRGRTSPCSPRWPARGSSPPCLSPRSRWSPTPRRGRWWARSRP